MPVPVSLATREGKPDAPLVFRSEAAGAPLQGVEYAAPMAAIRQPWTTVL